MADTTVYVPGFSFQDAVAAQNGTADNAQSIGVGVPASGAPWPGFTSFRQDAKAEPNDIAVVNNSVPAPPNARKP